MTRKLFGFNFRIVDLRGKEYSKILKDIYRMLIDDLKRKPVKEGYVQKGWLAPEVQKFMLHTDIPCSAMSITVYILADDLLYVNAIYDYAGYGMCYQYLAVPIDEEEETYVIIDVFYEEFD